MVRDIAGVDNKNKGKGKGKDKDKKKKNINQKKERETKKKERVKKHNKKMRGGWGIDWLFSQSSTDPTPEKVTMDKETLKTQYAEFTK